MAATDFDNPRVMSPVDSRSYPDHPPVAMNKDRSPSRSATRSRMLSDVDVFCPEGEETK